MTRLSSTLALIVLFAALANAADLADYQKRIRSARGGIQDLLSNVASEEADEEPDQPTDEVFAAVRELLPTQEKLTTPAGEIETNNRWFVERLKAAEDEKDLTKRAEILNEIDGRLAALGVELRELQEASAAERSKDEDKRKLAEILSRPEFQKPAPKPRSEKGCELVCKEPEEENYRPNQNVLNDRDRSRKVGSIAAKLRQMRLKPLQKLPYPL